MQKYKLICYTGNEYTIIETQADNIETLKVLFSEWKHSQQNENDLQLMFIVEGEPIIHDVTSEDI